MLMFPRDHFPHEDITREVWTIESNSISLEHSILGDTAIITTLWLEGKKSLIDASLNIKKNTITFEMMGDDIVIKLPRRLSKIYGDGISGYETSKASITFGDTNVKSVYFKHYWE